MCSDYEEMPFGDEHPNWLFLRDQPKRVRDRFAEIPLTFPRDIRHELSSTSMSQSMEHYRGISLLVSEGAFGSAAALLRSQFECYVRSIWMYYCATEDELAKFGKDQTLTSRQGKSKNKRFGEYLKKSALPENLWAEK